MTCKDCIHYEACKNLYETHGDGLIGDSHTCDYFKDRSRFVELPVKPGEKVYYFDTAGRIYKSTVTRLVYGATKLLIDSDVMFDSNLIGERFFLTHEEAEQALKEREKNEN